MIIQLPIKHLGLVSSIRGLILRNNITPIYFNTRWGIHTFGVKESIDVVILDEKNTVQKIKKSLMPNSVFLWNPKFKKVLELPQGTIEAKKITPNDVIVLRYI